MLDAPLGRTPAHALEGKLNIMAAGDRAVWERAEPVLKDVGENVFHLGDLGAGHTVKLLNNFLGMTTANAVAELFAAADLAGVDRQNVYDVISAGPLRSMMMDFVSEYALKGNPAVLEFAIKNGAKGYGCTHRCSRMPAPARASPPVRSGQCGTPLPTVMARRWFRSCWTITGNGSVSSRGPRATASRAARSACRT